MRKILILILCLDLVGCATNHNYRIIYPSPTGFVVDDANIIDVQTRDQIRESIEKLKQKTSAEIAVVTVDTTYPLSIEKYSYNLFQQFGIGKRGIDNGVLILIAYKDHRMRIEVGGLKSIITNSLSSQIITSIMAPEFEKNNFSGGIEQATDVIVSKIESIKN